MHDVLGRGGGHHGRHQLLLLLLLRRQNAPIDCYGACRSSRRKAGVDLIHTPRHTRPAGACGGATGSRGRTDPDRLPPGERRAAWLLLSLVSLTCWP